VLVSHRFLGMRENRHSAETMDKSAQIQASRPRDGVVRGEGLGGALSAFSECTAKLGPGQFGLGFECADGFIVLGDY
jgi:hypothetical protein